MLSLGLHPKAQLLATHRGSVLAGGSQELGRGGAKRAKLVLR